MHSPSPDIVKFNLFKIRGIHSEENSFQSALRPTLVTTALLPLKIHKHCNKTLNSKDIVLFTSISIYHSALEWIMEGKERAYENYKLLGTCPQRIKLKV